MKVLLIVGIIGLLLVVGAYYINNDIDSELVLEENKYSGPVPIGYNLKHFRETGETIREMNK